MAKDPAERYQSAGELLHEINRAFSRRTRAAFTPPGPIEVPEETGIRAAEVDVSTRETPTQEPDAARGRPRRASPPRRPRPRPARRRRRSPGRRRRGWASRSAESAAPAAPAETRIGEPPPDTEQRDEVAEETGEHEPGETRVGAAGGETRISPGETRIRPPRAARDQARRRPGRRGRRSGRHQGRRHRRATARAGGPARRAQGHAAAADRRRASRCSRS